MDKVRARALIIAKIIIDLRTEYGASSVDETEYGDSIYFGVNSSRSPIRGSGFRLVVENGEWRIGVKQSSIGNFKDSPSYSVENEFEMARTAIFKLYNLKIDTVFTDILTPAMSSLVEMFENGLVYHEIKFEKKVNQSYIAYKSPYSDKFLAFQLKLNGKKLVCRIKHYAPLECELNNDTESYVEFPLDAYNIETTITEIRRFYDSLAYYNKFINSEESLQLLSYLDEANLPVKCTYGVYRSVYYELENKKKISIYEKSNGDTIIKVKLSIFNTFEEKLSDDSIKAAVKFLCPSFGSNPIPEPITQQPEKPRLSEEADFFIKESLTILDKSNISDSDIEEMFDFFDENLSEEDCQNQDVIETYNLLVAAYSSGADIPESVRFVYISKQFKKEIDKLDASYVESLKEIKTSLNTLKDKKLNEFLLSKRLVYIHNFLKIRVKNDSPHRIIFCYGNKVGKNKKDIYVFSYCTDHNFDYLKNIDPSQEQYEMWKVEKTKDVPPLIGEQEKISTTVDKPLICTGCAGSGKTLISVYMYWYLLDKYYGSNEATPANELVYVTYNKNAKENAVNQALTLISSMNSKTIYEFFYDIAKDDVKGLTYADENNFFEWWKTGVSDFRLKNQMNSIVSLNPALYVYTFFRGMFKGSMYRWELSPDKNYLSKEQFIDLMSSEPISKDKANLLYSICEMYEKHLKKNKLYDDNDIARLAIRRLNKSPFKYSHIIVDEVQDLTEVQLDGILKASRDKRRLYFFGDQNQSINPTLFNLDFIEMCLRHNGGSIDSNDIYKLKTSYRFGPLLANYINNLVELKRDWIGALSIEETESSNKDVEKNRWAGITTKPEIIDSMLKKASNSANTIIIVPDNAVKEQLREKYGDEFVKRVTTIYDSKGLEWDYVVLFNMLSYNNERFIEMINKEAKHSTLHRMIFNQYYVGCTRALSCFSVLEENLLPEIVNSVIYKNLQQITLGTADLFIQTSIDPSSWLAEANRLFDAGLYELAFTAFEKSGMTIDEDPKMKVCMLMLDKKETANLKTAVYMKEEKFYREAEIIFENCKKPLLGRLMSLYRGVNISIDDAWEIINNEKLTDEDMDILNKSGFLTKKSQQILDKMDSLRKTLEVK